MMQLLVFKRGDEGDGICLWPTDGDIPVGTIQETGEYIFELRGVDDPNRVDLFIDDFPIEALRNPSPNVARWRWMPGFYAGRVEVRLEFGDGSRQDISVVTDPDLDKLTRDDFNAMVREILEDTFALFSLSGFREGIGRGGGNYIPPIAQLEFLRSRIVAIEEVIRDIAAHPVRILHPEEETRSASSAQSITAAELQRSFKSGPLETLPQSTHFTSIVRGAFPRKLRRVKKIPLLDIGEHRAIKGALETWRSWLSGVAVRLASDASIPQELRRTRDHWAARCRILASRLSRLLQGELFEEVGEPIFPLVVTSIFRSVVSYSRFYRLYHDMNLGIAAVQGDFLEMPLARTCDLYELWAFLRLVRAIASRYGIESIDPKALFDQRGGSNRIAMLRGATTVRLGPRAHLAFKRSFREYWTTLNRCGSFTREMVPDVSFSTASEMSSDEDPEKILVLDAKYRIQEQLNDAVTSLHTYRDAIVQETESATVSSAVVGAYILTPYVPSSVGIPWTQTQMPGRLFHPDYRTTFKFGAATLRPGMSLDAVGECFAAILADVGMNDLLAS